MTQKGLAIIVGVGAQRGLGGAMCKCFAAKGLDVIAVGRNLDRLEETAAALNKANDGIGGTISAFAADATDPVAVGNLFAHAAGLWPPLRLLALHAGTNRF